MSFGVSGLFDFGISVDHVILDFQAKWDADEALVPAPVRDRQEVTLTLAADFLKRHKGVKAPFEPLGVAQGWSPKSYARAVAALQKMGYRYIAMGGMVPLASQVRKMMFFGCPAIFSGTELSM